MGWESNGKKASKQNIDDMYGLNKLKIVCLFPQGILTMFTWASFQYFCVVQWMGIDQVVMAMVNDARCWETSGHSGRT